MFGQKIAVDLLVTLLEENGLAPVAALCDMMRDRRDNDASETSHGQSYRRITSVRRHRRHAEIK
jgi:hypothetical protein